MKRKVLTLLIIACVVLLIIGITMLVHNDYTQDRDAEDLSELKSEYDDLSTQNKDFVGWLEIETIDGFSFPVMQTPDDEEYYLRRNFEGEDSVSGTPFAAVAADLGRPSDNIVIYGHHMQNGTMFGPLRNYKDPDFLSANRTISFTTLSDEGRDEGGYEIFAVLKMRAGEFPLLIDASNAEEFDEFVEIVRDRSLYSIEAEVEYGDKLLTLSTCEYSQDEGRMVVVARRIL